MLESLSPPTPPEPLMRQVGKELRARNANLRIGGDERGFGLLNIRPAFEQLRRYAGGKILRRRRECIGIWMRNGARILAKQKCDRVLLLLNLLFELRHLRRRRVEQLFRLAHVGERHRAAALQCLWSGQRNPAGP